MERAIGGAAQGAVIGGIWGERRHVGASSAFEQNGALDPNKSKYLYFRIWI
jgi:hypothetical protein